MASRIVRTRLDEFFACGRGPIQNLDIKQLMDKLVARAPTSNCKQYIPMSPQGFILESRYRAPLTSDHKRNTRSSQPRIDRDSIQATRASWLELIGIHFDTRGVFHDDRGYGWIDRDFNDGCSQRNLPGVRELCMNWGLRRAHLFTDSGARHCYSQKSEAWIRGNGPDQGQGAIIYYQWTEVACTWPAKRALVNEPETVDKRGIEEGIPEPNERKRSPGSPAYSRRRRTQKEEEENRKVSLTHLSRA